MSCTITLCLMPLRKDLSLDLEVGWQPESPVNLAVATLYSSCAQSLCPRFAVSVLTH